MQSIPIPGPVVVGERIRVRASRQGFEDATGRIVALTDDGFTLALEEKGVGRVVPIKWANVGGIERDVPEPSETLVRLYTGRQQADAAADFQQDADSLSKAGYEPASQSWAQGQWGPGAFIVALLLCIVLVGILVFAFLLIVKPDGTLTVTYRWSPPRVTKEPVVDDTKVCPRCAETIKAAAVVCRFCGQEFGPAPD